LVFLLATVTLLPFLSVQRGARRPGPDHDHSAGRAAGVSDSDDDRRLLLGDRLAGIGRMLRANVIATSGRAVEAAGDVDVLLLDKTGTITLGNRQASASFPRRRE
jgi:K+-transporting ATPase ATPase B chain